VGQGSGRAVYHPDMIATRHWITRSAGAFLALGVLGVNPAQAARPAPPLAPAAIAAIQAHIAASGAEVAVAFRSLEGDAGWERNAAESFHAASTMKVPVLIELMHQQRAGRLRLDDPLVLRNEFRSLVDGSPYTLDPADDSETELYAHLGETRSLGTLAELMITVSSNLATNLLIERLGVANIRRTVHALGADGMQVLRGVEDPKAFAQHVNNTTTAAALCTLLRAIATGRAVDTAASARMLAILERQQFNEAIPAGVPPGTAVAHKTGDITAVHHDAAIVFAPRPYVLVILTRGLDEKPSAALMAQISREVYAATQR